MSDELNGTFSKNSELPAPSVLIVDGSYTIAEEPIEFFEKLGVESEAIVHVTNAKGARDTWRQHAGTLKAVVMSNRLQVDGDVCSPTDFFGESIISRSLQTLYKRDSDRPFVIFNSFDDGFHKGLLEEQGVHFPDKKNDFDKFRDELRQRLGLQVPETSPKAGKPDSEPS